jgi:hypothetical protein
MTQARPVDVITSDSPVVAADPDAQAAVRPWKEVIGVTAIGLAVALLILLHLFAGDVDPVSGTLSDYALGPYGLVFDFATLALAAGSVSLLGPVLLRGLSAAAGCCGCWCLGLVALTVFPRDPGGVPVSLVGEIHRYAAVATLVALPVGALVTAARHSGATPRVPPGANPGGTPGVPPRAVTVVACGCLVALVPFVIAYLAGSPLMPYVGLIERAVAVAELVLLLLLGTWLNSLRSECGTAGPG